MTDVRSKVTCLLPLVSGGISRSRYKEHIQLLFGILLQIRAGGSHKLRSTQPDIPQMPFSRVRQCERGPPLHRQTE